MNLANSLAQGSWITSTDDDDELTPDHVEVLLHAAREQRVEFVWSKSIMDTPDGWQVLGGTPMGYYSTTSAAVMWSSPLRFVRQSSTCWKLPEPQDINLHRRLTAIGVHMGYVDRVTFRYYPSFLGPTAWQTVLMRCHAVCEDPNSVDPTTAKRFGIDEVMAIDSQRAPGVEITAQGSTESFGTHVASVVREACRVALRGGETRVNVYAYRWDTWSEDHKLAFVSGLMAGFSITPGRPVINIFPVLV